MKLMINPGIDALSVMTLNMEDGKMGKGNQNWEPDIRRQLNIAQNWSAKSAQFEIEKSAQPDMNNLPVRANLLRGFGQIGGIVDNFSISKSSS